MSGSRGGGSLMAAQLWVTGAVSLWIKAPFDSTPRFLGHGEKAPSINFSAKWQDVITDLSGLVPMDYVYAGESARVTVDLIRFDMAVLGNIQARARSTSFPTAVAGFDAPGQRGTLALVEGSAYTIWCVQSFANKSPFTGLPRGFRFPAAIMDDENWQGGSAQALKVRIGWNAYAYFTPGDQNTFGYGSFTLWDSDVSALNGLSIS